jgi:ubiquinone/menaquinone biosynthesis C-methylase UbiE
MTDGMRYEFVPVPACTMCGSESAKMLGMRLSASQGLRPRRAEGISVSVKQCRDCGLVYADPQPIPASLDDHYKVPPEEYWIDPHVWSPSPDYFGTEIRRAKRLLDFTPGMKALDVGVGLGKTMRALVDAGFDSWGIEPSATFREQSSKVMGLDLDRIQLAPMEQADFPEHSFDLITFAAVLEHLYDPNAALERAMRWVRPGGIVHAEVPSSNYLLSKLVNLFFTLRGTNYVTHISPMHPPYHLFEFTPRSFGRFEIAHLEYLTGVTPKLPRAIGKPLEWVMKRTKTGMQLIVFLRMRA